MMHCSALAAKDAQNIIRVTDSPVVNHLLRSGSLFNGGEEVNPKPTEQELIVNYFLHGNGVNFTNYSEGTFITLFINIHSFQKPMERIQ